MPYYRLLSHDEQTELRKLIRVFLAEKKFEGCGDLEMTDEIRVTIAGQACILLLSREHDYYAGLHSILVYPSSYLAPSKFVDPAGVVHEGDQSRLGEAWLRGSIILSWDDVRRDSGDFQDGHNVTFMSSRISWINRTGPSMARRSWRIALTTTRGRVFS